MKNIRDKEMQGLEYFCIIAACAVCVLSILFLFDFMQNYWFLNTILGLGVLLHVSSALLFVLRHRHTLAWISGILALFYGVGLVYFNI